jgi:hypothetical protein
VKTLWATLLGRVRSEGCDVFIIPDDSGPVLGCAYVAYDSTPHILMLCSPGTLRACRVLLHEFAHHALGHVGVSSTRPTHMEEFEAEIFALKVLENYLDVDTHYALEQQSREYIRGPVQEWLDFGITQHGEVEAGVWAGCDIPWNLVEALR